jgi:drug/metabolite transporter (DMT)-like permease
LQSTNERRDVLLGFFWAGMSVFATTVFFITSKYALNNTKILDFFVFWYICGFTYNTINMLFQRKRAVESFRIVFSKVKGLLAVFIIMDITATFCGFTGLTMVDPSINAFMNQLQVLFTMFLGFLLLKERFDRWEFLAAILIIVGVFTMTYKSVEVPVIATFLFITANFAVSLNLVLIRKLGARVATFVFAVIRTVSLIIFYTTLNLLLTGSINAPPPRVLAVLALGAFFGPFLNVVSLYKALDYLPAGKASLFRSLIPFFVLVSGAIIFGSIPGTREIAGGSIIIVGSVMLAYFHSRHVINWKAPMQQMQSAQNAVKGMANRTIERHRQRKENHGKHNQ